MNQLQLGGVILNPQMVWSDRFVSQGVAQSVMVTLGGNPVVYSQGLVSGKTVTLEAQSNRGWLKLEDVDALMAMAEVPGAVYTLFVNGVPSQVVFRHNEPPAVSFEPLVQRLNNDSSSRFTGILKLMTV